MTTVEEYIVQRLDDCMCGAAKFLVIDPNGFDRDREYHIGVLPNYDRMAEAARRAWHREIEARV